MMLQEKVDTLHNAKVINKEILSDAFKSRLDSLSDEDIERLIEIADKLDPDRTHCSEISLLF